MLKRKDQLELECQEYYDALIAALRYSAYRCGYALAVHGSLKRDIDLIACPWRDSCINAEYLVQELKKVCEAVVGCARTRDVEKFGTQPELKPCGRKAWSIYLTHRDDGPYLDVSVMPKVEEHATHRSVV